MGRIFHKNQCLVVSFPKKFKIRSIHDTWSNKKKVSNKKKRSFFVVFMENRLSFLH